MVMDGSVLGRLRKLSRLYNVQTSYYDVSHQRRQASTDSLLAVLRALGAPVTSMNDVTSALREREQVLQRRILEPVNVVWENKTPLIMVRLPANLADGVLNGWLELESGERQDFRWLPDDISVLESTDVEGTEYVVKQINLPVNLPWGYHKFSLEIGGNYAETLLISAPEKAYIPSCNMDDRVWGAFIPLYSLQTKNSIGSGDYSALGSLAEWASSQGAGVVATLPLLPTFLDEPFEPSPYAPVSRLLWNEFFIDLDNVPELSGSSQAKEVLQSDSALCEIHDLRDLKLVDYRRIMALKRHALEEGCRYLVSGWLDRSRDFQEFVRDNPVVEDYARFRAAMEKQRSPWFSWPQRMQNGDLKAGDYEEKSKLYYVYAQWLAHCQIGNLADTIRKRGITMYFDLPLGAHKEGYDVWRQRDNFSLEATVGAPPDAVFTCGQNWMFPPPHPEKMREQGYSYFRAYIHHHLRHAGMLRIDHVMGLHRLFWIPEGLDARHGVYVRYPAEEFYAILALESQRHRSIIVGEDLGTVPAGVRPAMSRHGLQRMYVVHYELADNSTHKLHYPHRNIVASLNTHDMPPFAAFWQGLDIPERHTLGLLNKKSARSEKRSRRITKRALYDFLRNNGWLDAEEDDIRAVLKACLAFLSASRARVVLINIEDLWLETESQNIPSTDDRNANWCRKARYSLEEFCRLPEVRDILEEVDRLRKQRRK
jgi:4-alpha-glucanotransferase